MTQLLPHFAVIGLGANLGDARQTLQEALQSLENHADTAAWQVSPLSQCAHW